MDIDREVAEKVMGWEEVIVDIPYQGKVFKMPTGQLRITDEYISEGFPEPFTPSTSIVHAFEVVERLMDGGKMQFLILTALPNSWTASFNYLGMMTVYQGKSKNPAEAICLAALKAKVSQ